MNVSKKRHNALTNGQPSVLQFLLSTVAPHVVMCSISGARSFLPPLSLSNATF